MDYKEMSREQLIQELHSLRSGDMFHILAETMATPIFIFQGAKMKYVNSAAVKLTGYSEEMLLARDFWKIVHPDFQELVKKRGMARQQNKEVPSRYELKIITNSGEERWLQYSGRAFEYHGKPAVLGTVVDITEYRDVKLELERFHAVMDQAGDAIFVSDLKTGLFVDVNQTACRLLGYSRDELLKLSPKDIDENYPFEKLEEMEKFVTELIRSNKPYISENSIIRRKDGSTFPIELSLSVKDFRGKVYLLGIVRDITVRRQIEERMRQAEESYRVLYENIPSMYFTLSPAGTVISVNKFGASELGYAVEELVGQSVLKVFQKKDAPTVLKQLKICLQDPYDVHEWQIQKVRKDGTLLWVEEFARMIDGPDGTPNILIVCQDITRRKLAEDALQEAKKNLERRVEERTSELVNANIFLQREISERKRVEEALQESQERLQTLMEKIPNGVGVISLEGKMIYTNPALLNLLEYSEIEFLKIEIPQVIHPDDQQRLMEKLQYLFEGGPEYISEYHVLTKTGKVIPVEISSRRIIYDRKPVILSVVKDIAERKKAEDALRLSEARNRTLIEQAGDGIFVSDENGKHLDVNSSGCNMLGYTRDEILRLNVRDLYPVEDLKVNPPKFELLKKGVTVTGERRLRHKDGAYIFVEATAKMLPDSRIRKRAGEQLKKEHDRAQRYLDIAGVVLVVINADQKVELVNKKGCEILEYAESEIVEKNWFDHFVPEPYRTKVRTGFERLIAGEVKLMEYFENPVLTKSGTEKIIAWRNTILTDHHNQIIGTLSSGEDITERKIVEEELNRHRIHLEELVEQRTDKLRTANRKLRREIQVRKRAEKELKHSGEQLRKLSAHLQTTRDEERARIAREIHDELGQALSIIQLDLNWLELNLKKGEEAVLEKIQHMSSFTGEIIKEIQRISQELRPSVLDHLGFSAALAWQAQEFTRRTGIHCDFLIKSENIKLNNEQSISLFRVLQETLTNVIRHAKARRVTITLAENNGEIKLTVRDDGIGIPSEKINDPNSLGLIGIRERIVVLEGRISIKGKPNKGTILQVSVPIKKKGGKSNESSARG
jgi:PAS domain S-box-containing protein